jgi:hypothetical protein
MNGTSDELGNREFLFPELYYQEIMTKWIYLPIPCGRSLEHASQSSLKLSIKPNMGNINLIVREYPKCFKSPKESKPKE